MNRIVQQIFYVSVFMFFLTSGFPGMTNQGMAGTDLSNQTKTPSVNLDLKTENLSELALQYAHAMAAGQVKEWAALDLGCLARKLKRKSSLRAQLTDSDAQACWDDTMAAHADLVYDETEQGIFGALGRGTGFGLIHASHRHADFWKDYPPALSVSPSVVQTDPSAPVPVLQVKDVLELQRAGLTIEGTQETADVKIQAVDLLVTYPDPLTAPLALLPDEPWWASPMIRRYGPVRNLVARFTVAVGLKALGYPIDQAVVNEALPGAPVVARPSTPGILPSSPNWWDRSQAPQRFDAGVKEAQEGASFQDRVRKYQRLLLLDPKEPRVNALYGTDLYRAFLQEGLKEGKISSEDEAIRQKLGELYWNIQAQTWRQNFTEVAAGHSFAADAFYKVMPAFEISIEGGQGDEEMRRRLGALYRWNNDTESALAIHEEMLKNIPPNDPVGQSHMLSEIAWNRVQWLSWNRRYEHPWMTQARKEAEQSVKLAQTPLDKLIAGEALVILDALAVPRDQKRLQTHMAMIRTSHDELSGVEGLWSHLVGNDIVKSLTPEGLHVTLPAPTRSPEVMPLEVHSTIQDQNFLNTWNFDQDSGGNLPEGFATGSNQEGSHGNWQIESNPQAPSPPQVMAQSSPCANDQCFNILLDKRHTHELPDIVVHIRHVSTAGKGEAGIALAVKDSQNFDAVTLNSTTNQLKIYRVSNGKPKLLGEGEFKSKEGPWHVLRVQMVNSAHVDHPWTEIYVDGYETMVMASEPIGKKGHVGLVTKGDMVAQFDGLRVIEMITNRPLSRPAAY